MYNQYYYPFNYPYKSGFLSNFKKINWSNFLDRAHKTLGVINQAIPVIYQIKPIYQNAKTAFKVVNSFKKETSESKVNNDIKKENIRNNSYTSNAPTYFL